jgi:hypothetical protein
MNKANHNMTNEELELHGVVYDREFKAPTEIFMHLFQRSKIYCRD